MTKSKKSFVFTNQKVRALAPTGRHNDIWYDKGCKGLSVEVAMKCGDSRYYVEVYSPDKKRRKVIGSVFRVGIDQAREIVNNIMANKEEFLASDLNRFDPLINDFTKNGFYPRRPIIEVKPVEDAGHQKIVLLENVALKQKIKEYQEENIDLKRRANGYYIQNMRYKNALDAIKAVLSRLDDNKEETKDENN